RFLKTFKNGNLMMTFSFGKPEERWRIYCDDHIDSGASNTCINPKWVANFSSRERANVISPTAQSNAH
ncbi:unnamed protein product, partial [Dovyalis caffra]